MLGLKLLNGLASFLLCKRHILDVNGVAYTFQLFETAPQPISLLSFRVQHVTDSCKCSVEAVLCAFAMPKEHGTFHSISLTKNAKHGTF